MLLSFGNTKNETVKERMYRMHHQNLDKSNNFFKQNVFNEKLNITKNPFTWHLGDPSRAQLFDIFPISLNDGLYSQSEAFARTL